MTYTPDPQRVQQCLNAVANWFDTVEAGARLTRDNRYKWAAEILPEKLNRAAERYNFLTEFCDSIFNGCIGRAGGGLQMDTPSNDTSECQSEKNKCYDNAREEFNRLVEDAQKTHDKIISDANEYYRQEIENFCKIQQEMVNSCMETGFCSVYKMNILDRGLESLKKKLFGNGNTRRETPPTVPEDTQYLWR